MLCLLFSEKIDKITSEAIVDPSVYNGTQKLRAEDQMFMSINEVKNCIMSIKIKNSEGFDRVPQKILIEGIDHLLKPLCKLFGFVYKTNTIPEQWQMSKIIPVHKNGSKFDIENYRPVANLCSASKIFERLILNRIS